jgi:hypothetical protein
MAEGPSLAVLLSQTENLTNNLSIGGGSSHHGDAPTVFTRDSLGRREPFRDSIVQLRRVSLNQARSSRGGRRQGRSLLNDDELGDDNSGSESLHESPHRQFGRGTVGRTNSSSLGAFVEEQNASSRSLIIAPDAMTLDSRDVIASKQQRSSPRRTGSSSNGSGSTGSPVSMSSPVSPNFARRAGRTVDAPVSQPRPSLSHQRRTGSRRSVNSFNNNGSFNNGSFSNSFSNGASSDKGATTTEAFYPFDFDD